MIRRWFSRWFSARPVPAPPVAPSPTPPAPPPAPYVPFTDAEREEAGRAHAAARAAQIAAQVHVNEFQDPPEVCAARAADPAWQAEQAAKREVASADNAAYRLAVGLSVEQKRAEERF